MHPAIASSSISPYMWIVTGPTWTTPLCGEGIDASRVIGRRFCREPLVPASLEEDLKRQVRRTAAFHEIDRPVEIDVVTHCELGRLGRKIARPLERLDAPGLDQLGLVGDQFELCRSHRLSSPACYSVGRASRLSP